MEPVSSGVGSVVVRQAWPWTATLTLLAGIPLDKWVLIATLVYTVLQIFLSLRKVFTKDKRDGGE